MLYLTTFLHVVICLFLIIVVLLQSGKAADLAGAFGGMGSQTVFGPRGTATVLSKATTIAAALFMVTSLVLVIMANNQAPIQEAYWYIAALPLCKKAKRPSKSPKTGQTRSDYNCGDGGIGRRTSLRC